MVIDAILHIDSASSGVPWLFINWKSPEFGLLFGPGNSDPGLPLALLPLSIATMILSLGYRVIICWIIFLIWSTQKQDLEFALFPVGPVGPVAPVGPVGTKQKTYLDLHFFLYNLDYPRC